MQKTDQLIHTKLHQPFTRPGLVSRSRLQEQIARGLCGPLTLITAPAGFGKTTLVASCIAEYRQPGIRAAWLSLDKSDNQAGRFLNYLVAALQEVDPNIGNEAAQLAATQQAPAEAVLTSIINDLDIASAERALVLDDYQFISSQAVHDAVVFLLEHCPQTFHLVIATRSDPPFPLARLRVRGQVVELRAGDLRFTETEAALFLNDVMGLCLDCESIALLAERTEGWVAGLQMAALSMRNRKDVLAFIEGFSGSNRYILDYLLEEVLDRQSAEAQQFLLRTSILERLTARLCEAVSADDERSKCSGDDQTALRSTAILDYLDRANLFLVPLDDERVWYRYHHLFQDLLIQRMKSTYAPAEIVEYHRRAADWLETNDFISESIQHSLIIGDYEKAADIVEQYTLRLFGQGKLHQLLSWTGMLPEELIAQRPRLSIYQAWILGFAGKVAEAQQMANIARQTLQSKPLPIEKMRGLELELAGIQGFLAICLGDAPAALALSQLLEEQDVSDHLFPCSVIHWSVGFAHRMQGNLAKAIQEFEIVVQMGEQLENSFTILSGTVDLGLVLHLAGRLREAEAVYRRGLQLIDQLGNSQSGYIGRLEFALSGVLYDLNALVEARQLALSSVEHNRLWDTPNHTARGFWSLAQALIALGELDAADLALQKAESILAQSSVIPAVRANVETLRVRWWLAKGETEQVDAWFANHRVIKESTERRGDAAELLEITAARVWIAQGNRAAAWEILNFLEPDARKMERVNSLIQILILKSLAAPGPNAALENLEEAIGYAQPEGYQRMFLDEGQPLQVLLAQWLAHAKAGPLRDYTIHLLSQFPLSTVVEEPISSIRRPAESELQLPKNAMVEPEDRSAKTILIDPLSQRELEVLHLMSLGRTNQEIARQLVVATGTIKAHAASIFRKLDVANRTEAVARARQFGLIP